MKSKIFLALLIAFTLNQIHTNATSSSDTALHTSRIPICGSHDSKGGDPTDIKVVVSQKRIWFVADEMPMNCLKTKITNAEGKTVLEKCFSSKTAEWFLNIEALPKGEYTLHLGTSRVEKFKK
ncbi:MAG: DUF3244 domain-containing protein [Saprospiraceae bacterium]